MRLREAILRNPIPLALLAASLGFAACSSADRDASRDDVPAQRSSSVRAHAGKPGAPVKIQGDVTKPLPIGQATEILVLVTPQSAMDSLQVAFHGEAGLSVQSGGLQSFSAPTAGVALNCRVTVVGARDGLFHLAAVATARSAGAASGRVVSIPVIVGNAAVQKMQIKTTPPRDATGERIKSLPATERIR